MGYKSRVSSKLILYNVSHATSIFAATSDNSDIKREVAELRFKVKPRRAFQTIGWFENITKKCDVASKVGSYVREQKKSIIYPRRF